MIWLIPPTHYASLQLSCCIARSYFEGHRLKPEVKLIPLTCCRGATTTTRSVFGGRWRSCSVFVTVSDICNQCVCWLQPRCCCCCCCSQGSSLPVYVFSKNTNHTRWTKRAVWHVPLFLSVVFKCCPPPPHHTFVLQVKTCWGSVPGLCCLPSTLHVLLLDCGWCKSTVNDRTGVSVTAELCFQWELPVLFCAVVFSVSVDLLRQESFSSSPVLTQYWGWGAVLKLQNVTDKETKTTKNYKETERSQKGTKLLHSDTKQQRSHKTFMTENYK